MASLRHFPESHEGPSAHLQSSRVSFDLVVIGAGAAGLASAIFAARTGRGRVLALDGSRRLGAKILISGGGRCNITNRSVTERDFHGGNRNVIRQVLRALPVSDTLDFFREIGVSVHEEEDGKLFPDSNRAQTVLHALLEEAERRGVTLGAGTRVTALRRRDGGFAVETPASTVETRRVVVATGGLSVPETGSDGSGYAFARGAGHRLVETTPALVPLLLEGTFHQRLRGVSHRIEIDLQGEKSGRHRRAGSLLWTHFGASGPVALDVSRDWHRAVVERRAVSLTVNLAGGRSFESIEAELLERIKAGGRASVRSLIAPLMPASVAEAVLADSGIAPDLPLHALPRETRRRLVHAIVHRPLPVTGSRGYRYAEATAGGVDLSEIHAGRMESRCWPGLFLAGEILDVDGRLGGFNFQWAWSSGYVAGRAAGG
jgi:predicted Rossmann fold flavoprotein